ncbi:MAG: hypothetical protein ACMUIG_03015 [Thermoplasmatota archaeon]
MQTAGTSDKYARLERFLDNMESVTNPNDLNEPFRTLWFRIHGLTEDEVAGGKGVIFSSPGSDGIEVAPSKGVSSGQMAGKGTIEVVSPKDVGPTLEMIVAEKKKVTFKAASDEDLETVKIKEQAAKVMVDLQQKSAPLKGMGGVGSKLFEQIREVAILYRDDEYMDAMLEAGKITKKLEDDDFKKSIMVYLQKKMKEYQDIGGDLKLAQERFKEMAVSYKEGKSDFISLAGSVNKLCEDAIKGLISEQVVAEVEVDEKAPPQIEQPVVKVPLRKRITTVKTEEKATPELAPSTEIGKEDEEKAPEETIHQEEVKPIIKVVKKKIVLVPEEEEEEEEEDFTIDDIEEEIPEPDSPEETAPEEEAEGSVRETPPASRESPPQTETVEKKPEPAEPSEKTPDTDKQTQEAPPAEKSREKADLEAAFKKIQFVYNVSLKMHNAGKDVSQLFDMITYAESVRQKGETKTYIGVANQLESMLISLQNKKS